MVKTEISADWNETKVFSCESTCTEKREQRNSYGFTSLQRKPTRTTAMFSPAPFRMFSSTWLESRRSLMRESTFISIHLRYTGRRTCTFRKLGNGNEIHQVKKFTVFGRVVVGVSECPGCQKCTVHSALLTRTIVRVKTTQDQGQKVNMRYSKQHTIQV